MRATLRIPAAGILLTAAFAVGCFDSAPPPPVATTVTLNKTAVSLDAIGATDQLSATVKDQNGATMTGVTVTWSSSASGVAGVSGTGLVTAVANGTAQVTATSGSASASAAVTVAQVPAVVQKVSGDEQTGAAGTALGQALSVQVNDGGGNAVQGVTVTFAASADGSVSPGSGATGADGRVSTTWTLPTATGTHSVTATPGSGSGSAQFTATAVAGAAAALAEVSGNGQTGQVGAALANLLVVEVADAHGNPVQDYSVAFAPATGSGSVLPTSATTDASGLASTTWTLGPATGTHTVQASATGLTGSPITFTATATGAAPASVEVHVGDGQTGLVGYEVNRPPAVIVKDASGTPFAGATVTFAVTSGGGSATSLTATTGADGVAEVGSWTLGATAGANTLTATVTGSGITGNPVTFTASAANKAFDIEVRYLEPLPSAGQQAAFDAAVARWETIIFGDIPGGVVNYAGGSCNGVTLPAINETVDDLVIYAQLTEIDGPGNVLGQAGPCLLRNGSLLTAVGVMKFDTVDLPNMESLGLLDEVVMHEMGHVLGYGTLWASVTPALIADPSDPSRGGTPGADTHFTGEQALWAFDQIGGANYTGGAKVPVENDNSTYGSGSLDAHWRESVFATELMTPALNGGLSNPISMLSAASMGDLGYTVNYAGGETYALPGAALAAGTTQHVVLMHGDVLMDEIHVLGPDGRIARTIRRR